MQQSAATDLARPTGRRRSRRRSGTLRRLVRRAAGLLTILLSVIALLALAGGYNPALDVLTTFAPVIGIGLILFGGLAIGLVRREWRFTFVLIALIGLCATASRILPEYLRVIPQAAAGDGPALRVLTFNTWRKNGAPEDTIDAIAAADADIVLLQETESGVGRRLPELRRLYPYRSPCINTLCGETILSKRPFTTTRFRVVDAQGWDTAPMILYATTTAPDGGPVQVATFHYTWPLPGKGQESQRRELRIGLRLLDKGNLIAGGDMNLTPWSFAMARQDVALAPLVRQTRGIFSFPSHRAGGWRALLPPVLAIDQLYAGPEWRQVSALRLPATGSDHFPVLVTLARRRVG